MRRLLALISATGLLAAAPAVHAAVNPQIAGLQVALRAHGLYLAQIDGIAGPRTSAALHAFQRKHGLPVGVASTRTRRALGPLGDWGRAARSRPFQATKAPTTIFLAPTRKRRP